MNKKKYAFYPVLALKCQLAHSVIFHTTLLTDRIPCIFAMQNAGPMLIAVFITKMVIMGKYV